MAPYPNPSPRLDSKPPPLRISGYASGHIHALCVQCNLKRK